MSVRAALNRALVEEMARDERVFCLGEDIADPFGGSWKVTQGLSTRFGADRVRNTPISESAIVGAAASVTAPVPQPTSSTRWSGSISATSTVCSLIAPPRPREISQTSGS